MKKSIEVRGLDNNAKMKGLYPEYNRIKHEHNAMYSLLVDINRGAIGFWDNSLKGRIAEAIEDYNPREDAP